MNKNEIRIGDVLYGPSITCNRVIEHKIVDMYMEQSISGWGTIITTESQLGRNSRFASDITHWRLTKEDAQKELDKCIKLWGRYPSI